MEEYTIEVIKKCDNQSLISFISQYQSYTVDTVTLSILELKRRRYDGFSSLSDKISKFCKTNNVEDKDELFDNFFEDKDVDSYEELLKKNGLNQEYYTYPKLNYIISFYYILIVFNIIGIIVSLMNIDGNPFSSGLSLIYLFIGSISIFMILTLITITKTLMNFIRDINEINNKI